MHALVLALLFATQPLTTVAERSDFTETGRYAETISLCHAFAQRYPKEVRCTQFGTTPEGRPMMALIASADGTLTPAQARAKSRPVVLFQGGIHAGEIDGKDAGFWLLRDLLDGKELPGALGKLTAVFVPVFNVDGHERFGPNNRPNQVGPKEMGWRVNAQNLNLNRDYSKIDTPEMAAMLRLMGAWDPILMMDLHVTDGAQFQPDVAIGFEPQKVGPAPMRQVGQAARTAIYAELGKEGHTPLEFYPSFLKEDDPASGFAYGFPPPRLSNGYWPLRNRFTVLVETHSWKDYKTRVKTTRDAVVAFLRQVSEHGAEWLASAQKADDADRSGQTREVALLWKHSDQQTTIDFGGYAYTRTMSDLLGRTVVHYDLTKPEVWKVPYFPEPKVALSVELPRAGYLVPAPFAPWLAEKLALHGFHFSRVQKPLSVTAASFRATKIKFADDSYEGHQAAKLEGNWAPEPREFPAGSLYVPAAQPGVALLAQLLEPTAPDAFAAWGFFNPNFEQKEYIEDYVLDPWAHDLLKSDAKVKAEFEQKMKDPVFANDPKARQRFFAERHPTWDKVFGLYPVARLDEAPAASLLAPWKPTGAATQER